MEKEGGKEESEETKKQIEKLKGNQNEIEKIKKIIDKIQDKKCSFPEAFDSVKQLLGEFSEIITLPSDDESKQKAIKRIGDELSNCVDFLDRKELSPAEVIEKSTAVQGTFCTKNPIDWIESRRQLVNIGRNVKFRSPTLTQRDNIVEHDSQSSANVFDKAVEKSGWGLAAELRASHFKVGEGIKYEGEYQQENTSHQNSSLCTSYFSKTTCSVVPVALWAPTLSDVFLCKEVVEDLKRTEDIIAIEKKLAKEKVNDIFQKYGSHFYCGNVHFGGLFQVKTEFQTEKESKQSSIKDIVSTTHAANVHACFHSFGIVQIEKAVSGQKLHNTGKIEENQTSIQLSKIHTSFTKLGGPTEIDLLGLWKKGLVQNNNSWVVVDGGKPVISKDQLDPKDFVGLWNLVQSESSLFKDSIVLSSFLLETWDEVSGLKVAKSTVKIDRIHWYQSKINQFIEQIDVLELTSESCLESFETLSTIIHECGTAIGHHTVWKGELMNNGKLHSLLERLPSIHFKDIDALATSQRVKKLLNIGNDVNFPHKAAVLYWLKEMENPSTVKLFDDDKFDSIENVFRQFRTVAANDKISVSCLTGEMAKAITKILIKFRTEKTVLDYMVFVSFVLLLDFDIKNGIFRVHLTSDKICLCIDVTEKVQAQLMKMKVSDVALQAFVLQNIIQSIKSATSNDENLNEPNTGKCLIKSRFVDIREDIVDHFSSSLDPTIKTAIRQNDVDIVCCTLKEVADGQLPVSGSQLSWKYFEHISSDSSCSLQGTDITNRQSADPGYTADKDVDRDMANILHTFGLEKYYPEKISVQMALSIHDYASTNANETNIPWVILKKVISANSDFREMVLKDFLNNSGKSKGSRGDLVDNLYSSDEDETIQSETYHPSDVFIAIFQCCDPFLKRLIVTKLSFCQFAVPILYSDYINKDLVFSTWPINDIVLHGETEALVRKKTHSLSFIRFGKGSVPSKSKFINEFLREINEEHATFIHKDCPLGMKKRTVSRGMVELSWFVPDDNGTKSDVKIGTPLNIFNLRGDAHEFEKQLAILLLLSNLMVISISCDDLQQDKLVRILQTVHSSNVSVIIMTDITNCKEDKHILRKYIKEKKIDTSKTRFISTLEKSKDKVINATKLSSSDLKVELATNIVGLLRNIDTGIQIEDVKNNLPDGIRSDESPECVIGRRLAEELLKQCTQDGRPKHRKDTFLPLQGKLLWHEVSKKEKDLKRTKSDVFDNEDAILTNIRQLRKKQTHTCNEAPIAFSLFVETLLKYTSDEKVLQYFIVWFKEMLNKESRVLRKELLQNFLTAFKSHESTKDNQEVRIKSKEQLDLAEDLLDKALFGIEHFFREVGQVYEAFMHTSEDSKCNFNDKTENVMKQLPHVVAKLLLLGQPFEIMDGDAANVPQKWVTAVLTEVQNIVGSEKKIVTVSVLGIQSSGKSTLLNTMFGLEFSVSAGRCTRGIYIQIVPVKRLQHIQADYMLILDTEGLRTPERSGDKVHHDNEIATLIVGLADVVLLNLNGETIADMSNILEIVITGLLRLAQVNKNLALQQSCIFIHQNVSKDANTQMLQGNRNIIKSLDDMTNDVAIQENIADINHFADVINFNPLEDIKYVPELLHGSPGMGPVNHKYSVEVTNIQKCILREKVSVVSPLTFENYLLHLQSLWQGIQAEDFIFSFRSILEIKSYGILESEYQRLIWEVEELKLDWMNNNIKPRLQPCQDVRSITECALILVKEWQEKIETKYEESDNSLQDFVKTSDLQEHMEHYIVEKRFNMKSKISQLEKDTLQSINQEKAKCTSKLSTEGILTLKEKQITSTARSLARDFSGKKPSREEMNNAFQKLWTKFSSELASELPQKSQEERTEIMIHELKSTLNDLYTKHSSLLRKGLKRYAIYTGPFEDSLMADWPNLKIGQGDISIFFMKKIEKLCHGLNYRGPNYHAQARNEISEIFIDIDQEFYNLLRQETEYNQSQFSGIMKKVITKFKSLNSANQCFKLTPQLEISVALRVARHSFYQFHNMNKNYEDKYGLKARFEAKKTKVYQMFINTCEKQAEEIIATNILCDELKISIEEKLQRELQLKMFREIVQKFNHQKHHLIKHIMEHLAINEQFNEYISYIRNPETYVQKYLNKITDRDIFQKNSSECSSYSCWLEVSLADIFEKVKKSAKITTNLSHSNMCEWLECFLDQIKRANLALTFNHGSFQLLLDHDVKSYEGFLLNIIKNLSELETNLLDTWKEKSSGDFKWSGKNPYDLIYNFLWGCASKCPWCHEPCQKSDKTHASERDCHNCIQHRPNGVAGMRIRSTDEIAVESCNFDVQSTFSLGCSEWCGCSKEQCDVYHPFREYKKYMKEWDIQPLADMSNSKYWNWFMNTFSEHLAEYYGRKQPKIPSSWKSLTKDDAIRSLSEVYVIT
ncbi:Hypothetical predicted protein [Mytilus galloprovincialis]|uniref:VLIG-type G domain-containing protein n=1 Tax=Mytilus galloprovincialis TaxID=29158 RepID=A0A8B6EUC5_MYTGA|nr:Hypothetical predicted protein [Mytilus galloprovincialis]